MSHEEYNIITKLCNTFKGIILVDNKTFRFIEYFRLSKMFKI